MWRGDRGLAEWGVMDVKNKIKKEPERKADGRLKVKNKRQRMEVEREEEEGREERTERGGKKNW